LTFNDIVLYFTVDYQGKVGIDVGKLCKGVFQLNIVDRAIKFRQFVGYSGKLF